MEMVAVDDDGVVQESFDAPSSRPTSAKGNWMMVS